VLFSTVAMICRVSIFSGGFVGFSILLFFVVFTLTIVTEGPVEVVMRDVMKR
jgi:hypothetical protein